MRKLRENNLTWPTVNFFVRGTGRITSCGVNPSLLLRQLGKLLGFERGGGRLNDGRRFVESGLVLRWAGDILNFYLDGDSLRHRLCRGSILAHFYNSKRHFNTLILRRCCLDRSQLLPLVRFLHLRDIKLVHHKPVDFQGRLKWIHYKTAKRI